MTNTDKIISTLFRERWSGDLSGSSIEMQKLQLAKNIQDQVDGYWSEHTAYGIMTDGGFLVDSKKDEDKKLTELGVEFMESMKGWQDKTTVLITDEKLKIGGQPIKGKRFVGHTSYYDHNHTGSSPDIITITVDGKSYRVLSTSIDTEDYGRQLRNIVERKLGACVGDTVIIERSGSGCFSAKWVLSDPHVISRISANGSVYFDGDTSNIYAPKVKVIKKADGEVVA